MRTNSTIQLLVVRCLLCRLAKGRGWGGALDNVGNKLLFPGNYTVRCAMLPHVTGWSPPSAISFGITNMKHCNDIKDEQKKTITEKKVMLVIR